MSAQDAAKLLKANIEAAHAAASASAGLGDALGRAAQAVQDALLGGKKVMCCGNGGSAADCAHLTAELAGRYATERRGYCAIDLTANNSLLTALANDYDADHVFARQVESLGAEGDVLIALSTSGNSGNVQRAIAAAKQLGMTSVSLLGKGGGACKGMADIELIVASDVTARVQEVHLLLYHTLCEAIDAALAQG